LLEEIEHVSPDVVLTSECFLDGYIAEDDKVSRIDLRNFAIPDVSSPYISSVCSWSKRNRSWIILGCSRLVEQDVRNSALILNRDGNLVDVYDKIHCQKHDRKFVAGNCLPVIQSDFGLFGIMICADRRWPETVRTLALKGARVIFNPTHGMHDERNLAMMRTRSYESEVFIIFTHPAQALITGPGGEIITNEESDSIPYVVTTINLSEAEAARNADLAHLKDRRVDVYEM
jgi:predicted amidohydrolase